MREERRRGKERNRTNRRDRRRESEREEGRESEIYLKELAHAVMEAEVVQSMQDVQAVDREELML